MCFKLATLEEQKKQIQKRNDELHAWKTQLDEYHAKLKGEEERLKDENFKLAAAQTLLSVSTPGTGQTTTIVKGTIGSIAEFSLDDDWTSWCERLEMYIIANEVSENKKVSLFLTLLGKEGYALLRNLTTPKVPSEMSFSELQRTMKNHLQPAPNAMAERHKFKECRQKEGEDIKKFLTNLKRLSTFCEFGTNLESSLRDQFVWVLASDVIKKKLLGEKDLQYQRAVELALSLELAVKNAAEMRSSVSGATINYVTNKEKTSTSSKNQSAKAKTCYCCGKAKHVSSECKYKTYKCNQCGKQGHLKAVCKNKVESVKSDKVNENKAKNNRQQSNKREQQHFVKEVDELDEIADGFDSMFHIVDNKNTIDSPIMVELLIEDNLVKFEVDTGSPISAISSKTFDSKSAFSRLPIRETRRRFKSYQGDIIIPKGIIDVNVSYKGKQGRLELFVIHGKSEPIIGRQCLMLLGILGSSDLNINNIKRFASTPTVESILKEFSEVFNNKLGTYNKAKFSLELKEGAKSIFCKPQPVPYAMREKLEKELDRLEHAGVIERVSTSDWATTIVPVPKTNGDLRVCGNFKRTVNMSLIGNKHPIPRIIDLATKMAKAKKISKLDLAHAYQQVELDEQSKMLLVLSTHKGLYKCNRLMYGVSSAPGKFQEEMEKILSGIDGVVVYFDDIFIFGETQDEHDRNLRTVLSRFKDCGLTVKLEKCFLDQTRVQFLGYEIDSEGLHVSKEKMVAVENLKRPENVTELRSFLGFLNYYSRFIRDYAKIVGPLYELTQRSVSWQWTPEREKAFITAKEKLVSHDVLVHYQVDVPIKVTCYASPKGIGAVLSHVYSNGDERPIAFASRVLTKAERNYSQLDREALGLVFGVKAFHQIIYGRKFVLETDHKPLTFIFGPKNGLPLMAASRVQRWAVFLTAYDFEIKHIKGSDNGPADSLSRNLITDFKNSVKENDTEEYTYLNYVIDDVEIIDCNKIREETVSDPILSQVYDYVCNGWPTKIHDAMQAYKLRQNELTIEQGCLMWGHKVVIPSKFRADLLEELHSSHMGIVKMKALARSYFWWPGLDKEIENLAKSCNLCLGSADSPPKSVLHVWQWPEGPNKRLHADFCGPINGFMYLIITDAYSKWVGIKEMTDITVENTIKMLREYFCVWGLPESLVTDNGPTFTSETFQEFLRENCVKHHRTAPYHPASNGAAENAVRTFKNKFKLLVKSKMQRQEALCKYLFSYRTTPHCTTGCTPAELQLGRKLRTRLNVIQPSLRDKVEFKQSRQQEYFRGNRKADFDKGDEVMLRSYSKLTDKWEPARVEEKLGPVTYNVQTVDSKIHKRHIDQLIKPSIVNPIAANSVRNRVLANGELGSKEIDYRSTARIIPDATITTNETDQNVENQTMLPSDQPVKQKYQNNYKSEQVSMIPPSETETVMLRRSGRVRKAPERLNL